MAYITQNSKNKKPNTSAKMIMLAIGITMIGFGSFKLFDNYQIKQQEEQRTQIEKGKAAIEEQHKKDALLKKESDKKIYHDFLMLVTSWTDAVAVADKTARVNLSGPIGEMQKIRRTAYDFQTDECLSPVKDTLISSMDTLIDFYIEFMGNNHPNQIAAQQATDRVGDVSNGYSTCLKSL